MWFSLILSPFSCPHPPPIFYFYFEILKFFLKQNLENMRTLVVGFPPTFSLIHPKITSVLNSRAPWSKHRVDVWSSKCLTTFVPTLDHRKYIKEGWGMSLPISCPTVQGDSQCRVPYYCWDSIYMTWRICKCSNEIWSIIISKKFTAHNYEGLKLPTIFYDYHQIALTRQMDSNFDTLTYKIMGDHDQLNGNMLIL